MGAPAVSGSLMKKVPVQCPKCGHTQQEPATGYSTVCKKCRQHFRLDEAKQPAEAKPAAGRATRRVKCFNCGTDLDVPESAQSTMCKRCSGHLDLRDYRINSAVSRNFRTKGRFVIDESGYLFNTDSIAGDVTIKGRLLGKLKAEGALELYSSAQIKGSFYAGNLIIPAGERFHWPEAIPATAADISGELVATIRATHTVILRKSARMFGDVHSGGLVVEPGAVFVGQAHVSAPKQ
jgi:cytoskeletal protein CcmA (bactofilin family)